MGINENINIGVKEPIHGYQNCNTTKILIFGGYVKVRESLYIRVTIWVNTILHHIRTIVPRYEGSCIVYRSEYYQKHRHCQLPIPDW